MSSNKLPALPNGLADLLAQRIAAALAHELQSALDTFVAEVRSDPVMAPSEPTQWAALPDMLTVEEYARYRRIGRTKAHEDVRLGRVPCWRSGRTVRIPKAALLIEGAAR